MKAYLIDKAEDFLAWFGVPIVVVGLVLTLACGAVYGLEKIKPERERPAPDIKTFDESTPPTSREPAPPTEQLHISTDDIYTDLGRYRYDADSDTWRYVDVKVTGNWPPPVSPEELPEPIATPPSKSTFSMIDQGILEAGSPLAPVPVQDRDRGGSRDGDRDGRDGRDRDLRREWDRGHSGRDRDHDHHHHRGGSRYSFGFGTPGYAPLYPYPYPYYAPPPPPLYPYYAPAPEPRGYFYFNYRR